MPKGTRSSRNNDMKNTLIPTNTGLPSLWGRKSTELDNWVESIFSRPLFNSWNVESYPTDEYLDSEGNLNIEVPLAGFKKEDIQVYIEDGYLVLHANKQENRSDVRYINQSVRKKELTRKWFLNDTFEQDSIGSVFEDGLLKLKVSPKIETKIEERKYIEVK